MKKTYLQLVFYVIAVVCFISCSSDSPIEDDNVVSKDNYYVKYEINQGSAYTCKGTFTTDEGSKDFSMKWKEYTCSETFGPVSIGFQAKVTARFSHRGAGGSPYGAVKIYVSKNNEPFVLKASEVVENGGMGTTISASYVIDF